MPEHPTEAHNLELVRKQAKRLIRRHRAHDPDAMEIIRANHPQFAGMTPKQISGCNLQLSDAQLVIARLHGFPSWPQMAGQIRTGRGLHRPTALTIDSQRIGDTEYRTHLAARKGLYPIGTVKTSSCGVRYIVADYGFAMSMAAVSAGAGKSLEPRWDDLLPVIDLTFESRRLQQLFAEVDRCTSKALVFFDTCPELYSQTAGVGLNCVSSSNDPRQIQFTLDAARLHETILAHELAHLRIELVDDCEDHRYLRDPSNLARHNQLQQIQSFVLDLKVNDLIEELGFDMSVIVNDQLETIRAIAENGARGERIRTKHAAAGIANVLAAVMLEQKRFRPDIATGVRACLEMIRMSYPGVHALACSYVESVRRHGYSDRSSIRKVIDECATLSFQATDDDFDPARDLIEIAPTEWMADKRADFMPGYPVEVKLAVWKEAAKQKMGADVQYRIHADRLTGRGEVRMADAAQPTRTAVSRFWLPPQLPAEGMGPTTPDEIRARLEAQLARCGRVEPAHPATSPFPPPSWPPPPGTGHEPPRPPSRPYMVGIGRWLSRVAFERQESGEAAYGYAFNNPVTFVDPTADVPIIPIGPPGPKPPSGVGPMYGRYCGPQNYVPGATATNPWPAGIDMVDDCCRSHDMCYAKNHCNVLTNLNLMNKPCETCNHNLCSCMQKAYNSGKLTAAQDAVRSVIEHVFNCPGKKCKRNLMPGWK